MKDHLPFCREFSVLCIEGEAVLKDSTFWWAACLTHKVSRSVYKLDNKFDCLGFIYDLVYQMLVVACDRME